MGLFDKEQNGGRKDAKPSLVSAPKSQPASDPVPTGERKLDLTWGQLYNSSGKTEPTSQHQPPRPASHQTQPAQSRPQQPYVPPPPAAKTNHRARVIRLAAISAGIATAGGAVALAIAMIITTITVPNPMSLRKEEQAPVIRVLAADGTTLAERGQPHDYIPVDLLPRHTIEAVVATEDRRFFDHWGVDPWGLARAMLTNMRAGRYAQGGSTLSQQLAKNLFLSSERRLSRKIEEFYLALWLELRLRKADILELYLNRVYFGGGAYGIEAASRRYFNKSARSITVAESAVLAGLLKAPSKYSPLSSPNSARRRARVVIAKMHEAGFLSADEKRKILAERVEFYEPTKSNELTGFEYAIDYILERLPSLQSENARALNIETTIDAKLQRHAQIQTSALIASEGENSQVNQASLILMQPTGAIAAMVGGANYAESQFNRATKARRQPGSTFKPFVYLAAVENGMTPDSPVFDLPIMIKSYTPRNDNGTYAGQITLRRALAHSINSVAVRLHVENGIQKTIAVANRLGVRTEQHDNPSLALGTSETSLIEMASAYAVFANGGDAVEPYVVRAVKTDTGKVLYQRHPKPPRHIVAINHVGIMSDMLNSALVSGTGRRAALPSHPAAGKTGTSQDYRDAWFIGYTANYVAGIWFGNDNGKPMNKVAGGSLPARLWRDVMLLAHANTPPSPLPGTTDVDATYPRRDAITGNANSEAAPTDPIAELLKKSKAQEVPPSVIVRSAKIFVPTAVNAAPPTRDAIADKLNAIAGMDTPAKASPAHQKFAPNTQTAHSEPAALTGPEAPVTPLNAMPPAHRPAGMMALGVR